MAQGTNRRSPYRIAFLFSRTGTYVSRTYVIVSVKPHTNAAESTHEKESNEDGEYPYSKNMVGPPPVKVLESASWQSVYV